MAAPHVAGVVALMFQRNKLQTFEDVKRLLVQGERRPPGALNGTGARRQPLGRRSCGRAAGRYGCDPSLVVVAGRSVRT